MSRHHHTSLAEELQAVAPEKLVVQDVSKSFDSAAGKVQALDRVSLQVGEGEFLCLVGASGCGKSTLLALIAGLEKPDSGEILADGSQSLGQGAIAW